MAVVGPMHNVRLPSLEPQITPPDSGSEIIIEETSDDDMPEIDDRGNVIKIQHGDGSITISLDGSPLVENEDKKNLGWFENLCEDIDQMELSRIAEEVLRGIRNDLDSRKDWVEQRAQGIKLLGLKIEIPNLEGATDGAPVEGMSRVRHPLLLEAVLRFQANARSELLPTDGPVKIRNDDNNANAAEDRMADALENDLNHYLTSVASEYYPDTDRMLFMLGFGGTAFKKVYFCPLRNRPVSESVDADDLIVNNAATDLRNARRVTHRSMMTASTIKRMQILGFYRDIELVRPKKPDYDAVQSEKRAQQGLEDVQNGGDDYDEREIYECYCELDIKGFEHKWKGKETGLPIPYRVTIDVSSKEILSIIRNYNEDTKELPEARTVFVKYTFVPGMGFYDIGLLNILGNTTNAVTAAWRELLDAGMFNNFPGFLIAETGTRQNTNVMRIPPGGGFPIKTNGAAIKDTIMPLPYKEPSGALMNLVQDIATTGMRIGGTSEQQVGEGRADAPVGTTLAMIEQATKVLNSVHKRLHAAQAEEFRLLVECFKEHPESFWQRNRKPAMEWDEKTFLQALEDFDLTPQADPNTASHGQRVMKIMALKQLQAANPTMYDPIAIDRAALAAIGWNNPDQFMAPPSAQGQMPPEMKQKMIESQQKQQEIQNKAMLDQAKAQLDKARAAEIAHKVMSPPQGKEGEHAEQQQPDQAAMMTAQARLLDARTKAQQLGLHHQEAMMEDHNRMLDRQSKERMEMMELVKDHIVHPNVPTGGLIRKAEENG
jgi:hypothetical protein